MGISMSRLATVVVLTGEARREDIPRAPHPPDSVMANLGELANVMRELLPGRP